MTWRRRFAEAMLVVFYTLAPSTVPVWRTDPLHRPTAVLMVGSPVRFLEPQWDADRGNTDSMAPTRHP